MSFFQFPKSEGDEGLGPPPGPFQFRPRGGLRLPGGLMRWAPVAVALFVLFIIAFIAKGIYANWLWFESVDYLSVYRLRIVTSIWLFFAGAGAFLLFFGSSVLFAFRQVSRGGGLSLKVGDGEPVAVGRVALVVAIAAALFLAVIFGVQAASQWDNILLFMNSQSFGQEDAAFGRDIGFYVFELPTLNFIVGWLLGLVILTTIAVAGLYGFRLFLSGFDSEAPPLARQHISFLVVIVLGLFVWRYWLGRFGLVFSEREAVPLGAAYTDINANLPVIYILMALASITALLILVSAFRRGLLFLPVGGAGVWVLVAIVGGVIYPSTVQRFQVDPNELSQEREFIQRNIDATREAYGLDQIDVLSEELTPAKSFVTAEEIADNPETIRNIRLWDHRPLLTTLNQIQTIRPLYDFLNVDVDRYVIDGEIRQVMLAARELNPANLPIDAQSWVNSRLQFTHGYGITIVPVNEVGEAGLPTFFVKDIPTNGELRFEGFEQEIIEQPRIYYGEMPDHYVIVNSNEEEFDFPIGDDRATTVFDGEGGIRLDSFLRRLTYAWELADFNILISDALNDESRLLYRRNIQDRVEAIAPFLLLDGDPYPVVADGQIYWIQDAFTHTDQYPYSTRIAGLNYIRNSVKVVINAYDGSTTFYLIDEEDPIAQVYKGIYPDLFTDFDEMPASLRSHLRYPEDLFQIQAQLYRRYHILGADIFFNREDVWNIPMEVVEQSKEQPIEPYYVIMKLPGETEEEFALILPFTPARRNNTVAWLAARSDGEELGKLLSFRLPTQETVFGPSQVEARIDQNEEISAQLTLWDQSGSQVIRGNLLMFPIGEGNIFIEPIYLQASTGRQLPELKRVVVVNGNNIAMEPTLERALEVVLGLAQASALVEDPDDVSPTPDGTTTGEATATPEPTSPLPDDVASLVAEANELFEEAQALLQQLDWAGYGERIDRLEEVLQALAAEFP